MQEYNNLKITQTLPEDLRFSQLKPNKVYSQLKTQNVLSGADLNHRINVVAEQTQKALEAIQTAMREQNKKINLIQKAGSAQEYMRVLQKI